VLVLTGGGCPHCRSVTSPFSLVENSHINIGRGYPKYDQTSGMATYVQHILYIVYMVLNKIIFGLIDIDLNVYFSLKDPENARSPYKIVVNQCRLNVRKKNFLVSVLLSLGIVCLPAWSILHLYKPSEEP